MALQLTLARSTLSGLPTLLRVSGDTAFAPAARHLVERCKFPVSKPVLKLESAYRIIISALETEI